MTSDSVFWGFFRARKTESLRWVQGGGLLLPESLRWVQGRALPYFSGAKVWSKRISIRSDKCRRSSADGSGAGAGLTSPWNPRENAACLATQAPTHFTRRACCSASAKSGLAATHS